MSSFFDAEFVDYLMIGWDHIIDIKAYDHLLFVMTLCALFTYHEWRKVLVIVTAFTIGHSLTLALSSLNYIVLSPELVETLIPVTILITAIANIVRRKDNTLTEKTFDKKVAVNYVIALSFGLIHGLGFAGNFRFLMGEENSILKQLFAFNSGLELGQITVVIVFMILLYVATKFFKVVHREWNVFFSGAGAGLSVMMIMEALF
ncbi:HupE/UreJ family protein [Cytophagaceae bacterium ABcell3]|nr:HupE/UreJ family protein [Cytophagaceae bacterium ABcell3]